MAAADDRESSMAHWQHMTALLTRLSPFGSPYWLLVALLLAVLAFFSLPQSIAWNTRLLFSWDLGVMIYLLLGWLLIMRLDAEATRRHAEVQRAGRLAIFLFVIGAACASVAAIGFMSGGLQSMTFWPKCWHLLLSVVALICAWLLMHTVFAFYYAHHYYSGPAGSTESDLLFPNDPDPDYLDFAYYSLVIGMTSQVSDVATTSRAMRRITLLHGVLSFIFNMALLALSINILASAL